MRRNLTWTLALLVAGACMMAVLLALVPAAGHDQLWFLMMARRWLAGAPLYGPEAFDSNPPMVVWLSALPVWAAAHVGMPATPMAKLMVVVLEAGLGVLALRALGTSTGRLGREARLWLAFVYVVIFGAVPARDFGQRDGLAAALLLPYVLLSAAWVLRLSATEEERLPLWGPFRVGAALLAALGVCLKPQLALVALAVEGVCLVRSLAARDAAKRTGDAVASPSRWVSRPEPWCLLAAGLLYVGAVARFAPLYLSAALPLTTATYWAIGHLRPFELFHEAVPMAALLFLAFETLRSEHRRGSRFAPAMAMLLWAGLGGVASYWVQGTGWYYQQLPGISFLAAVVALAVSGVAERTGARRRARTARPGSAPAANADTGEDVHRWVPLAAGGLVVLAAALTMHASGFGLSRGGFDADHTFQILQPDPSFFTPLAEGTPVAILTTSVEDAMIPVERWHLRWSQSMNNLWTLPAALRLVSPQLGDWPVPARHRLGAAQAEALAAEVRRREAADLALWQPQVVLVERCQQTSVRCQELEDRHDDLLAFFLQDAAFAREWSGYRWVRRAGAYDEYVRER